MAGFRSDMRLCLSHQPLLIGTSVNHQLLAKAANPGVGWHTDLLRRGIYGQPMHRRRHGGLIMYPSPRTKPSSASEVREQRSRSSPGSSPPNGELRSASDRGKGDRPVSSESPEYTRHCWSQCRSVPALPMVCRWRAGPLSRVWHWEPLVNTWDLKARERRGCGQTGRRVRGGRPQVRPGNLRGPSVPHSRAGLKSPSLSSKACSTAQMNVSQCPPRLPPYALNHPFTPHGTYIEH